MYCIPADLAPFHDFLAQLGVRDSFSAQQYVGIMADMAAALKGERLSAEQQEQAIAVLQVITGQCCSETGRPLYHNESRQRE